MTGGSPGSVVRLIKAQALGNDFLLLPLESARLAVNLPALVRRLCDRHRGIGADGVMTVELHEAGARTMLLNADGSPSEVSGNGVRCVAAWLACERHLQPGGRVTIDTGAGARGVTLVSHSGNRLTFRAEMGHPEGLGERSLSVSGLEISAVTMRVGNPQCVVLGPATEDRLRTIAAGLATHPAFPEGTNVELAEVESPDRVRILIWERGVGPTQASGTGACAAAVAAVAHGGARRDADIEVSSPGGSQIVRWSDEGLLLTGWAEVVAVVEWQLGMTAKEDR
jgi:diaminopimelate epimerase